MPTAWRLIKSKHHQRAFDGQGARINGGRWNRKGVAMVYTAESIALAALEIIAHALFLDFLEDEYSWFPVTFDEKLCLTLDASSLPVNWREYPAPPELKDIGTAWIRSQQTVILKVPSAIVPQENNFLISPMHPDFDKLEIGTPHAFRFDSRMVKP